MKQATVEVVVGLFVLAGLLALSYLVIGLGKLEVAGKGGYPVYADFATVAGLKPGAAVEIAGVEVGRVESIGLHEYAARVRMVIRQDVKLQEDVIASVRSKGLIGEKYVRLSPGGSETPIRPGGRIRETEAPIDLEEALGQFIFGKL